MVNQAARALEDDLSSADRVNLYALTTPWHVGAVTLTVRDLPTVADWYRRILGFETLRSDSGEVVLGAGGKALLVLQHDAAAKPATHREAGLFHTAFLLPTRADLGRWLLHASEQQFQIQGASDHLVSEAIYLGDPEGNGVEIYCDRPQQSWNWQGGKVVMATERLDLRAVANSAGTSRWQGAPAAMAVGHIHLQVGDVPESEAFYRGIFGLDVTCHYPGANFYSSGGYHHHVGANIWNSRGAGRRPEGITGLAGFEMVAKSPDVFAARLAALDAKGAALAGTAERPVVVDPWGNRISLIVA